MEGLKREGFVLYRSFFEAVQELDTAEARWEAIEAIIRYGLDGEDITAGGTAAMALKFAKPQIDANNQRYLNGCKGAEYGKLGGRPKNPEKTPQKPRENPAETPKEKEKEKEKAKEKVKESSVVVGAGALSNRLTDDDWDRLERQFEKVLQLIDRIDDQIKDPDKIKDPYSYILSAANRMNWTRKGGLS